MKFETIESHTVSGELQMETFCACAVLSLRYGEFNALIPFC
jgi:hypothetical protein